MFTRFYLAFFLLIVVLSGCAQTRRTIPKLAAGEQRLPTPAAAQFRLAERIENEKGLAAAVPAYRLCAEKFPDCEFAGLSLAKQMDHFFHTKQYAKADELLETIFKKYPTAKYLDKLLLKWILVAHRNKDLQKAYLKCLQLIVQYPQSPHISKANMRRSFLAKKLEQAGQERPDISGLLKTSGFSGKFAFCRALAGDFRDPRTPEKQQRLYEQVLRSFREAAEKGDADAQLHLGRMYMYGYGVKRDHKKAQEWLRKAAAKGGDYRWKAECAIASSYTMTGRPDAAEKIYFELIKRYPEGGPAAKIMAHLAQYYWRRGKALRGAAEEEDDESKAKRLRSQAKASFVSSARTFGSLARRFPEHTLVAKTTILSAQAYMQAHDFRKAIPILKKAIETYKDDKKLCPEAMYWLGDCYYRINDLVNADRMWKRLLREFPQSKWARHGPGLLELQPRKIAKEKERPEQE